MTRSRKFILVVLLIVIGLTAAVLLKRNCPAAGIAFSQQQRDFHRLKNRTTPPQQTDFDDRVTLYNMLQPGVDRARWSSARAARVEGYVVSIGKGGVEWANCYLPCSRDTHINVALRPDATPGEQVVLEITPRIEMAARRQGRDWSEETLKRELLGHWCSFEGWLFFDSSHAAESENTAPSSPGNWRATAWEIHPVINFQIIR
jgi:hypothetical protein